MAQNYTVHMCNWSVSERIERSGPHNDYTPGTDAPLFSLA